jgi:hypothetical protein
VTEKLVIANATAKAEVILRMAGLYSAWSSSWTAVSMKASEWVPISRPQPSKLFQALQELSKNWNSN